MIPQCYRQTERQTDRQTDTQTDRQTDRKTLAHHAIQTPAHIMMSILKGAIVPSVVIGVNKKCYNTAEPS